MNNHLRTTALLLLVSGSLTYAELTQANTDTASRNNHIATMKTAYYQSKGIPVLTDIVKDSTIGPGNFVAISNITVAKGATLTIAPGTTLYFEPQKKLIVEGTLLAFAVKGKITFSHAPIDFRYIKIAIADSLWNGIVLEPESRIFLNSVYINNAVTGITVSKMASSIDIACIDMSRNVLAPLLVDNKYVSVKNIRCVATADIKDTTLVPEPEAVETPAPTTIPVAAPTSQPVKAVVKISSCLMTAGGMGVAAYGFMRYRKYGQLYEKSTDPTRHSPNEVYSYKKKATSGSLLGISGGIAGFLGATGVTWSFLF